MSNNNSLDFYTLPNGLRVVGERLPYLRTVSIGVWLKVGSMMELPEENGLSHFLEHMVFKGTERRTARDLAEEMDAVGGQMDAFTGKDCTCLYAKVIDEDISLAIDILSDMAIHATLDATEFGKEKGVVLEEISMGDDDPEDVAHELLSLAQYGKQSPGMPITGSREQVSAYTQSDLAAYRSKHYRPENVVISLSGNYDEQVVRSLIEKHFGAWERGKGELLLPAFTIQEGTVLTRTKDTEQLQLCLGYPGIPYGDDAGTAMNIISLILGGNMSSRLFQRIREELGMAYSVYAVPRRILGTGTFVISAGVSPRNGKPVLEEIHRQVRLFCEKGMTEKEFRSARTQLRNDYLMSLESPGARMQGNGRRLLHLNKLPDGEEQLAKLESVTYDDCMALANRIFAEAPCLTVVGQHADQFNSWRFN